uniref:Uncharacterized protein n=1 Tax=Cacopsylla melanoneura TaxID=428564 RepID=A0A8D8RHQ0_9HEMI
MLYCTGIILDIGLNVPLLWITGDPIASVGQWSERPSCNQEVAGSINFSLAFRDDNTWKFKELFVSIETIWVSRVLCAPQFYRGVMRKNNFKKNSAMWVGTKLPCLFQLKRDCGVAILPCFVYIYAITSVV